MVEKLNISYFCRFCVSLLEVTKIAIKKIVFVSPTVSFKEISERPDLPFFYAALKSRGSCAG